MIIEDKVYGKMELKEKVLIDLINSKAVQRLKGIAQYGVPDNYFHRKSGFSRYEHSVGVMLLLIKLNTNLKEQIAGLLHDVSHTAFSHVIDHVLGDPTKEDFQDNSHLSFIENSEIPKILAKYNFDYKEISNLENFNLLENHAPDICADRIDYSLREFFNFMDKNELNYMINSFIVINGKIVFNSLEMAEKFAFNYSKCQSELWGSDQTRTRYYLLALALKIALDKKLICLEDFYKNDSEVINILINSKNESILKILSGLEKGFKIIEGKSKNSIVLNKKFRFVDPEFYSEGKLRRVSEVSNTYKENLNMQKKLSLGLKEVTILY